MLPSKKYTPSDVLQVLRRRAWLILLPVAIVAAGTAVVVRRLPDRFRSEALIVVVPQRVPEIYVKSTVTTRIDDRLMSMTQQILSRTRLERVIQDFNLYPDERRTGIMEDIVQRMRDRDISTQIVQGDSFRISYAGRDPRTVMKVTERLASLFIEENLRDRELQAESTDQFLESQLEDARRRLMEHEKKLTDYRKQYSGQLPSQLESNLQSIQNAQMQIQSVVEGINRDREKRLLVERQISEVSSLPDAPAVAGAGGVEGPPTTADQLARATAQLAALEARLKPDHPDVLQMKRVIRDLRKQADAEALAVPLSPEGTRPKSPSDNGKQKRLADLRADLAQIDRQLTAKQAEEQRLRALSSSYQARVEIAPTRESEMTELMRDYNTLQSIYTTLLAKKEESKMAANMERRQGGEQFKLLDPARLPEKPESPNRPLLSVLGMVGGLALGLALVALLEYRDGSIRTDDEAVAVLSLPVLAVVPLMQSESERRKAFWRRSVMTVGWASAVAVCFAVFVYTFVR